MVVRPVVGGQRDFGRVIVEFARAALGAVDEVLDGGATEPVERLIVVADDAHVVVFARQFEEDALLDGIRVLVFVDDDVRERFARPLGIAQKLIRAHLQAREVDLLVLEEQALVFGIHQQEFAQVIILWQASQCVGEVEVLFGAPIEEADRLRNRFELGGDIGAKRLVDEPLDVERFTTEAGTEE